jgi:hypothetical protein
MGNLTLVWNAGQEARSGKSRFPAVKWTSIKLAGVRLAHWRHDVATIGFTSTHESAHELAGFRAARK